MPLLTYIWKYANTYATWTHWQKPCDQECCTLMKPDDNYANTNDDANSNDVRIVHIHDKTLNSNITLKYLYGLEGINCLVIGH